MNFPIDRPRLSRTIARCMPLIIGIAIGLVWGSEQPAAVTAQSPGGDAPAGRWSNFGAEPNQPAEKSFRNQVGDRVTVVEAREGRDVAGSGGLIGFSHVDNEGTQVITIVDAEKRWMAVYHVGSGGTIRLASSREIAADFTLQLNATAPIPDEIRRLQGLPPRSE
ncbi:hypothetical protein [Allorhodopirellula solitaria]|uniref:Uncharacterized protein n=1 Tax=Allorhodopirellula solitaria TaxID=2527987 RepID=A0A5C5X1T5_9BACT|nr:hypothetical protein [Allorhodopirellula solitaria]TWT56192.1 hypothetical protein CA85_43740 [Allorhodopirellula solitaria]